MTLAESPSCPCGTGRSFKLCCGRFLDGGAHPDTAEELMRSRYTAYARKDVDYLVATHHPPEGRHPDRRGISAFAARTRWHGLEVLSTEGGSREDDAGVVVFRATFDLDGTRSVMRERSLFRRVEGRWVYTHEEPETAANGSLTARTGRNAPCPCGSGKKYKRCCGG